jgi:hypothetical protein
MNTRGLVELIVLSIGYDLGILSARTFAMLVLMALVTTFMTGPLLSLVKFGGQKGERSGEEGLLRGTSHSHRASAGWQAAEQRPELSPRRGFCEPWVIVVRFGEPRSGDRECGDFSRPFGARSVRWIRTQGSQSLALGLTLIAAPQLVSPAPRSRLLSEGVNQNETVIETFNTWNVAGLLRKCLRAET